jgi:hypothetical protein
MSRFLAPLGQRRTYIETVDLVLDLVVGVAWFSIFTTLVATGASLLFALVGLPVLTGTFLSSSCGRSGRTQSRRHFPRHRDRDTGARAGARRRRVLATRCAVP